MNLESPPSTNRFSFFCLTKAQKIAITFIFRFLNLNKFPQMLPEDCDARPIVSQMYKTKLIRVLFQRGVYLEFLEEFYVSCSATFREMSAIQLRDGYFAPKHYLPNNRNTRRSKKYS
ncbi:hypothetical protein ACK1KB_10705 [Chryseobacterium sp. TY3]